MVFEKNSTRTRVSFEAGMAQLGGHAMFLDTQSSQMGRGEPIEDTARVLSRMSDIIMIRTYEQALVQRLAAHSKVPVINGLTNEYHPCQILADIFTFIEQRGSIKGKTVAWIGDGNNVCRTWLQAAKILGFKLKVATPVGFELKALDGQHYGPEHFEPSHSASHAAAGAPGDHRRVHQHGFRGGEGSAAGSLPRLPSDAGADEAGCRTPCSCTVCRRTGARKWPPR